MVLDSNDFATARSIVPAAVSPDSTVTCGIATASKMPRMPRPIGACAAFHSPASPRMLTIIGTGISYGMSSDVSALSELPTPLDYVGLKERFMAALA